jgi:hypothetical protein
MATTTDLEICLFPIVRYQRIVRCRIEQISTWGRVSLVSVAAAR